MLQFDVKQLDELVHRLIEHGGELAIKPIKDGPLMFSGNLTIRNSSGRDAWHGDRVALCRCGQSANKPFCDGAHKQAGFKSE